MSKRKISFSMKIIIAIIILCILSIMSLSYGESNMGFLNSLYALFGQGDEGNITIVQQIRLPRVMAGIITGATLGLSGLMTRTALRNPLADSSILGIQSGASVMALLALLVIPGAALFLPFYAFIGGMFAFFLLILFSYDSGFSPLRLVLSGVAINAFFAAVVGVITTVNVQKLQSSINWTSGSLVGISNEEVNMMLIYAGLVILIAILCIPILELLKLEDNMLMALGKNPNTYRIIVCIIAVLLVSISLSFVGLIAFVGIIVPHVSQIIVGPKMKHIFIMTLVLGGILIVAVDLLGRVVFLFEIPVGILVGILGAPLFLYLLRGTKNGI